MKKNNSTLVSVMYDIKSAYASFSGKEKIIADFLLKWGGKSAESSITELAKKIGTSEATLVRFVKKIGYSGYQHFRLALAKESVTANMQIFEIPVAANDDIADSVFAHTIRTLEASRKLLNKKTVAQAASALTNARQVLLFGLGGSNVNAQDAFHKLLRTGLTCRTAADFHMQLMLASQSNGNDAALVFSHLGNNYDTISIANELRHTKCKVIALTSYDNSPLAKLADIVLQVSPVHSSLVSESFSGGIAAAVLINVLYVEVMNNLKDSGLKSLNKMRSTIARRKV